MPFLKLWNRIARRLETIWTFLFHSFVGLIYASDICKKQKKKIRSFLARLIEVVKNIILAQKSDKSISSS